MKRPRAELVGRKIDLDVSPQALEPFKAAWERLLRFGDWIGTVDLVRSGGVVLHTEFAARTTLIDARRLVLGVLLAGEPKIARLAEVEGELTPRERTVVHLITLGLTTPEIANRLSVSPSTVRTHVRNAMAKTGTKTRAQLVAVALSDRRTYDASD